MKIRLQVREPRTPEQERDWLLSKINSPLQPGRNVVKALLVASAFIALVVLISALYPRLQVGFSK
jgi:hypothetical protein